MKAAKVFIVLLTAFIVVIFTDCSTAEKKETEEIIHAKPVSSSLASKPEPSAEKKTGIISAGNNRVEYN